MKNYKITVSYDGSRYKGWQRLGMGELTIQGVLEESIETVLGYKVEVHGSGRTDAGVHARGQVVNMKVPFVLQEDFVSRINEVLPEDIRILKFEPAAGRFHGRFSATGKKYSYYVYTGETPSVFSRKYVFHFPEKVDLMAMRKAAEYLVGTHEFTSFTDDKTEKDKIRTIYAIEIHEKDGLLEFVYHGNGFLQHMIRILTGTLLEVGKGERKPEDMLQVLSCRERAKAGFMAPAKGLFLDEVDYD